MRIKMKIEAKNLTEKQREVFFEKFYELAPDWIDYSENSSNPWGMPWYDGGKIILTGETIEEMAVNYFNEMIPEIEKLYREEQEFLKSEGIEK